MKTKCTGKNTCPISVYHTREPAAWGVDYYRGQSQSAWYWNRWNGTDGIMPSSDKFPNDGRMSKNRVSEGDSYVWEYTAGPRDTAFMEAQDRKYLTELARTNWALFLKEMTPRGELSREDQDKERGLDLRLPHHKNLQREFAADVARISGARSSGVDVRRGGAGGARVAPEGSRRDAGRSDGATLVRPRTTASIAPAAPTRKIAETPAITVEENIRRQVALLGGTTPERAKAMMILWGLATHSAENRLLIERTPRSLENLNRLLKDDSLKVRGAASYILQMFTCRKKKEEAQKEEKRRNIEAARIATERRAEAEREKTRKAIAAPSRGAGGGGSSAASYKPALVISSTRAPDFDRKERERIKAEEERQAALKKERDTEFAEKFQRDWEEKSLREATLYVEKQKRDYVSDEQRKADVSDAWDCDIDKIKAGYHERFGCDISSEGRDMMEREITDKKDRQRDELRAIDDDSSAACSVM